MRAAAASRATGPERNAWTLEYRTAVSRSYARLLVVARARGRAPFDTLKAIAPVGSRHWILDVGCGDGLFFDRLHEMGEVEGIEPDASLVDPQGAHRHRIHIQPFDDRFRPSAVYSPAS